MTGIELKDGDSLVYTFTGRVAHISVGTYVVCNFVPKYPWEFMGTGSQAEYERAASLPLCKRCRAVRE